MNFFNRTYGAWGFVLTFVYVLLYKIYEKMSNKAAIFDLRT